MMRMRGMLCTAIGGLLSLACVVAWAQADASAPARQNLRILYAGTPGSEREKDFVRVLDEHFAQVKTADLASFKAKQAGDMDVVIIDYDGDGFKAPRPTFPSDYGRATVTLSVAGGMICDGAGLKSGYL